MAMITGRNGVGTTEVPASSRQELTGSIEKVIDRGAEAQGF